ncbi:hypothetical protein RKE29_14630 [Streptomyces sp. B1866]|uniref:hypothetical protein n=1 Tax=Streptomyces sp. B1866 TaxID=3075431 RepID=UPI002891D610|nr:hypothetical protein [Streptomyces sp. B1866]MDT3397864.1 hypothetical protein [Streptomyces sp. B1866]
MSETRVNRPELGRIGLCRNGEYADWFALLVPEIDGWRVCYLRTPESDSEDDFSTSDDSLEQAIGPMEIAWYHGEEAERIERAVFGLWDEWKSRQCARFVPRKGAFRRRR